VYEAAVRHKETDMHRGCVYEAEQRHVQLITSHVSTILGFKQEGGWLFSRVTTTVLM